MKFADLCGKGPEFDPTLIINGDVIPDAGSLVFWASVQLRQFLESGEPQITQYPKIITSEDHPEIDQIINDLK